MKNLILISAVLVPSFAMALDNCTMFPVIGESRPAPQITEVSANESFGNCPESVLVRDEYVGRLMRVVRSETEPTKCVYSLKTVAFSCDL